MLERNKRIKPTPERFQDTSEEFDVIFTVEERIYDAVLEGVCPYNKAVIMIPVILSLLVYSVHSALYRIRGTGFEQLYTGPSDQLGCQR